MRVPINWLSEFVRLPKDLSKLTTKLTLAGHMLDKVEINKDSQIIDLELRGNRADCYSILGIARETGALFDTKINKPKLYPRLTRTNKLKHTSLSVKTNLVNRVMMVEVYDIEIKPSPDWIKKRLEDYGIASINNIVDLTNYVMIETGQPMHAFDLDRIENNLQIRLAKKNEQMETFLGEFLSLSEHDLVWAMGDTVLSVAGAIGGKERSITKDTKNILLESANYDRANIRRSIHAHNLFTEAGIRHEKELDPNLVEEGIYRFLKLLTQNKWGKVSTQVYDYYPKPVKPWKVELELDYLRDLSGMEISYEQIKKVLESLEFGVLKRANSIQVTCPTHRTDVIYPEDLVEEVLRIMGYDQIPVKRLQLEIPKKITPAFILQEKKYKQAALAAGFSEVINIPFVKQNFIELNKNYIEKNAKFVKIQNRPSPEVEVMQMSLLPNLYEKVQKLINEKSEEIRLFEIGKVYFKTKNYTEKRRIGFVYWKKDKEDYRVFKGLITAIFESLYVKELLFDSKNQNAELKNQLFQVKMGKHEVGVGGFLDEIYYIEFDLDLLLEKEVKPMVTLWPKYPAQIEDITLVLPVKTRAGEIIELIKKQKNISRVFLSEVYQDAYTFRVWFQDFNKTLNNKEVDEIRQKMLSKLTENFGVSVKA